MQATRTPQQEAVEDIFFGQIVVVYARWFLIVAALILVLWTAEDAAALVIGILPVLALTAMNFFLHGRYLIEKPANQVLLALTSLLDIILVTMIIYLWSPGGLQNQFFIFYYPVVMAIGFVFPRRIAVTYTVLSLVAYAGVCYSVDATSIASSVWHQKLLVQRLITIAAMGGLSTYYWRIQRDRRRAAMESQG